MDNRTQTCAEPGRNIATLALTELRRRQSKANALVAARRLDRDRAEAMLRPWAALACRAGAQMAELTPLLDGVVAIRGPEPTEIERRQIVADGLCPCERAVAALATARDQAFDRMYAQASVDAEAQARVLHRLANWFRAPPYRPRAADPGGLSRAQPREKAA